MPDIPFSTYGFKSVSGNTDRTMPERINDIFNVKDFGAVGDNRHDDTKNIQAAFDVTGSSSLRRGIVFFPPGIYRIREPIRFSPFGELSIHITGVGDLSRIFGDFPDYLLIRDDDTASGGISVTNLTFTNNNAAGGCLKLSKPIGTRVSTCWLGGLNGLFINGQSCLVDSCSFSTNGQNGGTGINLSANNTVLACDITGFKVGIRMTNAGGVIIGCRMEKNERAIVLGNAFGEPGDTSLTGFSIIGISMESNGTGIDCESGAGYGIIMSSHITGYAGAAPWNGSVVSSTTITGLTSGTTRTGRISAAGILTIDSPGRYLHGEFLSGAGLPTDTTIFDAAITPTTYAVQTNATYGVRFRNNAHHLHM